MPTTTNYGWTTPADTDLVKDGAAAIRTLGSSADTTVKNLNPGTTAGDIDYYTSGTAKARIAIGTAGQILRVNSGATAPEWATAAAAGGLTLLNTGGTSIAGATSTTVSAISGAYKNLHIYLENYHMGSANDDIGVRLNGETGSNYRELRIERGNSATGTNGTSGTGIFISAAASATSTGNFAYAIIPNYYTTNHRKSLQGQGYYKDGTTNEYFAIWGGTRINSNDAITSISIYTGSGNNIAAGTLFIYGEN